MQPNVFTDGIIAAATLEQGAFAQINAYQAAHTNYKASEPSLFATTNKWNAIKTRATRQTREDMIIALFHYAVFDQTRVIQITGACAEQTAAKYEPVFDAVVSSIQTSR